MRAIDTNVAARFLLNDDEHQTARATAILREPVWIAMTVWLELGWVLSTRIGLDRGMVADALDALLQFDTVHTDDRDGLGWAIARYRAGADWADMVHLVASRAVADAFATFDQRVAADAGRQTPLPVETIA